MSYISLINRLLVALAFVALMANRTNAADVKWAVGNANWDTVTLNWLDGSANATNYVAGNTVLFDDTAAGATPILVTNTIAVTNGSITVSNVAKNYTLTGPGVFSNNVPLLKLGAGTITITTTNANYGGTFAVGGGTVVLPTGAALGTAATGAAMILSNGVILTIGNSGNATPAVPLVIAAGATVTNTANALGSGANGNVSSGGAGSVIYVNSSFTFGGQLTNFTGTLIANSGTTRLAVSGNGATLGSSNAHFIVTGTLQPRNNNTTIHLGSLSGAGTLSGAQTPSTVTTTTYRVGALGTNTTFGGRFNDSAGGVNPTTNFVALTKVGSGTLTLTNSSTMSGATIVSNGMLTLVTSGSLSNSAVTVAGGAAFGVTLASAGGSTTVSNLTFAPGTVSTAFGFGANAPSINTAPLRVQNNLAIDGTLNISLAGGPIPPGTYPLISYAGALSGTVPAAVNSTPAYPLANDTTNKWISLVVSSYFASPLTLVVVNTNDNGFGSLRQAVADAPPGATITFDNPISGATILLTNGQIVLDKNLTIDGSSLASAVQFNGNHTSRIFYVNPGVTVTNNSLIITNGMGDEYGAGGIYNFGTLTLNQCLLCGNQGVGGGAIANQGTLTVNNSTLAANFANSGVGGGIASSSGTLTVIHSTIANNTALDQGGGIYFLNGTLYLTNSIVCSNSAPYGPNIYGDVPSGANNLVDANALLAALGDYGGPTPTMPPLPGSFAIDTGIDSVTNTFATDQRGFARLFGPHVDIGAVEAVYTPTNPIIVSQTLTNVTASSATIAASIFPSGVATAGWLEYGLTAAYGSTSAVTVADIPFAISQLLTGLAPATTYHFRAVASNSFGVAVGSDVVFRTGGATNLVLNADDSGPGSLRQVVADSVGDDIVRFTNTLAGQVITLTNGQITLDKSLTIDATALAPGIAIDGNQSPRIFEVASNTINVMTALTITNAASTARGHYGGGILNFGTLTVNGCTISGNTGGNGGGIANYGTLTVNQSTISNNQARERESAGGGGILNFGTLIVNSCTLSGNSAGRYGGGGIYNTGTLNLTNSIVCSNSAPSGPNIAGVISSGANNLVDVNAHLAPLGDYGGPTPTMPPSPGSPAIDAGDNAVTNSFATDQRGAGYPRWYGAHVDIGAVEVQYVLAASPPWLVNAATVDNGSFQFNFTNTPGAWLTVWGSTNVALPFNQWGNLGAPVESPAGTFQFTDPQATNSQRRFYRVTSP